MLEILPLCVTLLRVASLAVYMGERFQEYSQIQDVEASKC